MPRAEPNVIGALAAQVDRSTDQVNDIGGLFDAIFRVEVWTDWHERLGAMSFEVRIVTDLQNFASEVA